MSSYQNSPEFDQYLAQASLEAQAKLGRFVAGFAVGALGSAIGVGIGNVLCEVIFDEGIPLGSAVGIVTAQASLSGYFRAQDTFPTSSLNKG